MLLAAANPRFAPDSMTRTRGHRRAASALPSVEALSTTMISKATAGGGDVERRQAALEIGARVVADDDDREIRQEGSLTSRRPFDDGERVARGARPVVSREHRWRGGEQPAARRLDRRAASRARAVVAVEVVQRHVERRVAAALARDRRVEQHRRHAGGQRLERRQPEALVFRQKRKGARAAVQRAELVVGHVAAPAHPVRRGLRPRSRWFRS